MNIGNERQLFLDSLMVSEVKRVERRLHHPTRRELVLTPDRPWETVGMPSCVGYFQDGDKYRLWYHCDDNSEGNPRFTGYAESQDGVNWEKPNLGILDYKGSRDNKLVKSLEGKMIRLRVVMKDADLFAFRFVD